MDLSTLSPEILASLATALQQGTSPTELLSQILHQNVENIVHPPPTDTDTAPPLSEAAPSSEQPQSEEQLNEEQQSEQPQSEEQLNEAPSEQQQSEEQLNEAPSEQPQSKEQLNEAPSEQQQSEEQLNEAPSEQQMNEPSTLSTSSTSNVPITTPVVEPTPQAVNNITEPIVYTKTIVPSPSIDSLPTSQASIPPQRYLSMAELRARHKINGHFYNASDAAPPARPLPTVNNFNPHFPKPPKIQPVDVDTKPKYVPLEVKPSPPPSEEEFKAFTEAARFHRANGVSMPYMSDEAMYRITKKNLQRPLTKPFHPEAAAKQMKATQDMIQNFIDARTAEQTQTSYFNIRTGRYELLPNASDPPPTNPRTLAQNRLKQLQERRQAQIASQSIPVGSHRQLQDRAAQLKQYLASKK